MNSDPVENSGENLCGICEFACRLLTEILANTCFPYCEGGRTGAGFSSARESVGHRRHGVPARPRTLHGAARPSPGSPCRRGPRTGFPRYAVARGTGSAPAGGPGRFLSGTTFRDGRPGARHGSQPSRTGRSFAPAQRDRSGQAIPEGAPRLAECDGLPPLALVRTERCRRRGCRRGRAARCRWSDPSERRPDADPGGRSRGMQADVGSPAPGRPLRRPDAGRGHASIAVLDSRGPMHQRGDPQGDPAAFSRRSRRRLRRRQERPARGAMRRIFRVRST